MSGARTYLFLLVGIAALVGASGGLGYYFFAILPDKQAEVAPPEETLLAALDEVTPPAETPPDTGSPTPEIPADPPPDTGTAWSIGPSARESRFGFKAPASAPPIMDVPSSTVVMDLPQNVERRRSAGAPMDLPPLYFEDLCEGYMGEFDLAANGAALDILPGGGEVALRIERQHIDLSVNENVECGPPDNRQKIGDIDCTLDVSLRLAGSGPFGAGSAAPAKAQGSRFSRWHNRAAPSQDHPPTRAGNPHTGATSLDAESHYAMGSDPSLWFTDVNGYPVVQYPSVFPGIDLDCYAERNRMEFIYTINPNGDPAAMQMAFDGTENPVIDPFGNMVAELQCGKIVQQAPRAFRIDEGQIPIPVNARFEQQGPAVRLDLPAMTHSASNLPPVGPQLDLLSYLGGEANDAVLAITVDHQGFTYVTGETASRRFAGKTPDPKRFAKDIDIFVSKYRNSDGHPVFTTFLGGTAEDRALAIAVAPDGSVAVGGETLSRDFPIVNAPDSLPGGQGWDGFLTRFDPSGQIVQSTRLGGNGDDHVQALALSPNGSVILAGDTTSGDFTGLKTVGPCGDRDAFVMTVPPDEAPTGVRLGGKGNDAAYSLTLDARGGVVVAGETSSPDFPTQNAWQATPGGDVDAFLVALDPALTLTFGSYVGAENDDRAYSVALDSAGYIYLTGETASLDLTVVNPAQDTFGGGMWDAFLCKFDPATMQPVYATYFGGSGDDRAFAVLPNAIGEATMTGETSSTNLPVRNAVQTAHGGGLWDGFATTISVNGSNRVYCTYLGGAQADHLYAAAMEAGRRLHLAGQTASTNLVAANAIQSRYAGGDDDGLLATISPAPNPGPSLAWVPGDAQPGGPDYGFYMARFETTNNEFVRFLNDAQAHTNDVRGTNLFFDASGNIWFNPEMKKDRDEVFSVANSRITYNPQFPVGSRYTVTPQLSPTGESYTNHPAVGVSWFGAVKYCNWLTIDTGHGAGQRCFREGTNTLDWAPVTCAPTNWARGIFTPDERKALLEYNGYRLPMDNCAASSTWDNVYLLVSNQEFVNFLNGIELPANDSRNANVFIDNEGNAWFNSARQRGRDELFLIDNSRIRFNPQRQAGFRYRVSPADAARPVGGVSPFGAMKYCNWLSLRDGIPEDQLAYREGSWQEDWAPATCGIIQWRENRFGPDDYQRWIDNVKGYRLPIKTVAPEQTSEDDTFRGLTSWPNPFNEFYAAAAWNGKSNTLYGFGRDTVVSMDANFLGALGGASKGTLPVGSFNGAQHAGYGQTHSNQNAYGIFDLSGNVAEWMIDPGRAGSAADRAACGGSWRFALPTLTQRKFVPPYFTDGFGGFRPVVSQGAAPPMGRYVIRVPYRLCLCPCGVGAEEKEQIIEKKPKDTEDDITEETLPGRKPGERLRPPGDDDDDPGDVFYRGGDDDDDGGDDDDDDGGDDDDDDDDDEPVVSKSYV